MENNCNEEYIKSCGQVVIPTVDNSSPCDNFISSECVIVTRRSPKLKNPSNIDLNAYFELLDNKLSQLDNLIIQIQKEQEVIMNILNNIPGGETLDIGTWAPGD